MFTTKFENAAKFGAKLFLIYKLVFTIHLLRVQRLTTLRILSDGRRFYWIDPGDFTAALIQGDAGASVSYATPITRLALLMRFKVGRQLCSRKPSLSRIVR